MSCMHANTISNIIVRFICVLIKKYRAVCVIANKHLGGFTDRSLGKWNTQQLKHLKKWFFKVHIFNTPLTLVILIFYRCTDFSFHSSH
jgi:hypothetical protein